MYNVSGFINCSCLEGHRPGLELPDVLQGADQGEGPARKEDSGVGGQKKVKFYIFWFDLEKN